MQRVASMLCVTFAVSLACRVIEPPGLQAQPSSIKRTPVLKADMAGMECQETHLWVMGQDDTVVRVTSGQEAHMWIMDLAPGATMGKRSRATPRLIYVLAGAVTVEVDGQPPQTFTAGEGFQERSHVVHNVRNASPTEPAQALGFQIAGKGLPFP